MPETYAQLIIVAELLMLLAGGVLLWRHGLSPAARRQAPALARWDLKSSDFLFFVWLVVCGGFLTQLAALPLLKLAARGETATLMLTGAAFHAGMLLGVIAFTFTRKNAAGPAPAVMPVRILPASFATFAIALPVITASSLAWQALLEALGVPAQPQDLIALFAEAKSVPLLVMMIIVATLMAPVTEELVFRGGFFRYARFRMPRWLALTLPACLFAALHTNLASFVPLAILGVIFSLAYERTGRIAVPIIAHGLFNLNTIILILAGVGP
jgi:membrane protease YdiL (CAAX protease family)